MFHSLMLRDYRLMFHSLVAMLRDNRLVFHSLVAYLLSGIKMGSAGNVRLCNTYEVAILTCGMERG